ncbi:P-loop containing region of AAA domain-containing protein [Bifidobacterium sp. DSM 109958]|uniref:P-loop containing region of AAA domain-containing protein n=1 Tax=Bifidobacterium moraviense TaxID=2675323 RepID=A0A7Y0F2B9_9BIFI|nr:ATP-binding protein [Bifidobacterium sp. DSM 109958]NMM99806.1 P-loop containing region of AAA domain-containing protein [Bifidobacterium sp. DSM 109958]
MAKREDMAMIADRWMLESRQVVNWGSYDGWHEFRPSTDPTAPVTLLAGASESGKSTLVDAQISLLYPTGTPFNKASNAGRSERSDYTYVRGMLGYGSDGGVEMPLYLRGRDADGRPQPVWGAIVDTYANRTTGQTLSCAKFLYLAVGDGSGDVRRQYAVWDRVIDPRLMDRYRDTPFTPTQIRTAYPGCETFPNADAFHARIWRIMGLSAEACRLLHKIQSADAPSRLDDIFKQGVLGVPEALDLARAAVDDWRRYEENLRAMDEKARRMARLKDIRTGYGAYADALAALRDGSRIDPDGEQGRAAVAAWTGRRMADDIGAQLPADRTAAGRGREAQTVAAHAADELRERCARIDAQLGSRDGGALARLETQLAQLNRDFAAARDLGTRLAARFDAAGETMPDGADAWERERTRLAEADGTYRDDLAALDQSRYESQSALHDAKDALAALQRDYERHSSRRTRISQAMDDDRALLVRATGLDADDLPYAAELMDVREEDEAWRAAMNVVYGSLAQTILVDRRHEHGFARKVSAIDPSLMGRRTWTFVDTDASADAVADAEAGADAEPRDGWMSGKLRYRDESPFAAWLKTQTRAERLDARCVDAIDDANRTERQVQRDGQIKSGRRGWHGTKGMRQVIGFADETYLDGLRGQIDQARRRADDAESRRRETDAAAETLRARHALAEELAHTPWSQVDADGIERRIEELESDIDAMRNDPETARLLAMRDRLAAEASDAQKEASRLDIEAGRLSRMVDAMQAWLDRYHERHDGADAEVSIGENAERALAEAYDGAFASMPRREDRAHALADAGGSVRGNIAAAIVRQARARVAGLRKTVDDARAAVELNMANYLERYAPDDDSATASVNDYRYYLEELEGLSKLAAVNATDAEVANSLDKMLMDFTQLGRAIDTDASDIGDQLERINRMLTGQRFGPRHGTLALGADVRRPDAAFSGQLRRVVQMLNEWKASRAADPQETRRVFARCRPLVDLLDEELSHVRDAGGIRSYGARNLDPRCRSGFYAIVHHDDGPDERISSTGGKSGGALQELTSFVYGAALIYLLGGDVNGQPTYTTLFLDEALIKADGRYTRRALSVLPRLGFQVIVSAPESKTAEILEVARKAYVAYRDPDTGRSYLQEIAPATFDEADAETADASDGADASGAAAVPEPADRQSADPEAPR